MQINIIIKYTKVAMAPIVSGNTGLPDLLISLPKRPTFINEGPALGINTSVTMYPYMENPIAAKIADSCLE